MTGNHPAALLRRLNPYCARALDAAASLCQTRAHAEITIEHWLLKLLEQGEGDITVIARRYEWDIDTLWQSLLAHLDTLPRPVRERPQLSEPLAALIRQAWLIASLEGDDPQIRSQHLLMALTEKPMLPACNDLWVLLSLSRVQLERLRPSHHSGGILCGDHRHCRAGDHCVVGKTRSLPRQSNVRPNAAHGLS